MRVEQEEGTNQFQTAAVHKANTKGKDAGEEPRASMKKGRNQRTGDGDEGGSRSGKGKGGGRGGGKGGGKGAGGGGKGKGKGKGKGRRS